jgi:hypothetical protein
MLFWMIAAAIAADAPPVERAKIFRAAGFQQRNRRWESCGDPGTAAYEPGRIEHYGDVNGDGRPEAIVTEGSAYCFGDAGTGFTLLTRSPAGQWRVLHKSAGMATFLKTRAKGWPELEVGGPGFCFPVLRWNGKAFVTHRHAYSGKRCRP